VSNVTSLLNVLPRELRTYDINKWLCYPSFYIFLYYCVCSVMYFIVNAAFVRIKHDDDDDDDGRNCTKTLEMCSKVSWFRHAMRMMRICHKLMWSTQMTCQALKTRSSAIVEIAQVGGHYAVQGRSDNWFLYQWKARMRLPQWITLTYILSRTVCQISRVIDQIIASDLGCPLQRICSQKLLRISP